MTVTSLTHLPLPQVPQGGAALTPSDSRSRKNFRTDTYARVDVVARIVGMAALSCATYDLSYAAARYITGQSYKAFLNESLTPTAIALGCFTLRRIIYSIPQLTQALTKSKNSPEHEAKSEGATTSERLFIKDHLLVAAWASAFFTTIGAFSHFAEGGRLSLFGRCRVEHVNSNAVGEPLRYRDNGPELERVYDYCSYEFNSAATLALSAVVTLAALAAIPVAIDYGTKLGHKIKKALVL